MDNRMTHYIRGAAWLLLLAFCSLQAQAQSRESYDLPDTLSSRNIVLKFHEGSRMRLGCSRLARERRTTSRERDRSGLGRRCEFNHALAKSTG